MTHKKHIQQAEGLRSFVDEMVKNGTDREAAEKAVGEIAEAMGAGIYDNRSQSYEKLPDEAERLLQLFDKYTGGHGVEVSSFEEDPEEQLFYVNMGDTYDRTLMYRNGRLFLSSLGDEMESG